MVDVLPSFGVNIGWVFLALAVGYFGFGYVLNAITPGKSPEILVDVPPYRMPTLKNVGSKLWVRTSRFFLIAVPFVLLGCVIVGVLYLTGAMDWLARVLSPVFVGLFGLPDDPHLVGAMVAGFLRKDLAVGILGGIDMTAYQAFISVVLLCIYFPCLATFALMIKEENWKELLGTLASLALMVLVYGSVLHLIGMAIGVC
jgi:ferrous iron transport protein B